MSSEPLIIENQTISSPDRRRFVFKSSGILLGATLLAAFSGISKLLQILFPSFIPKSLFKAGKPNDYKVGKVDDRWKDRGVLIVRNFDGLYALSAKTSDTGCEVQWIESEQKLGCACHGNGFYKSGVRFEGPAKHALERFYIGISKDGGVLIDLNRKFLQEKREWDLPGSLLKL
jgi:cytochrome b6-f complex iron-sulfur subunit